LSWNASLKQFFDLQKGKESQKGDDKDDELEFQDDGDDLDAPSVPTQKRRTSHMSSKLSDSETESSNID
jgi:hypothetical protein